MMSNVVHKCAYNNFKKIYPNSIEMDKCRCEKMDCECSICGYGELAAKELMKKFKR